MPTSDALYRASSAVLNEQERNIVSPEYNVINLGALHRRPDAIENKQGFSYVNERVRVKKLAHGSRIRIATWNIGTLTGKLLELVDIMLRRRVNIACLQKTKWTRGKARTIKYGIQVKIEIQTVLE